MDIQCFIVWFSHVLNVLKVYTKIMICLEVFVPYIFYKYTNYLYSLFKEQ